MRGLRYAALAIAAYLVFLAATVPASFLAARAPGWSDGRVAMRGAEGTAWHGRAQAVVATAVGPLALSSIAWDWRPSRLLAGRIAFDVRASVAGLELQGEVSRSPTLWHVSHLQGAGPASGAAAMLPLLAAWRPEGSLELRAPALAWNGGGLQGEASVQWRAAAVALSEVRPLGSYRIELRADTGPARIVATTLEGPLRITGQGSLGPGGRLAFSGEARAEGPQARALDPLLDLLGPRRPDGARSLEWRP